MLTMRRIMNGKKFAGIPASLEEECRRHRARLRHKAVLLGGHPTKHELIIGKRRRDGFPVSIWNVRCDKRCGELAEAFMQKQCVPAP